MTSSTSKSLPQLTLSNFTSVLSQQLTVADCSIYTYMSPEKDMVVLLGPSSVNPTLLQVNKSYQNVNLLLFIEIKKRALCHGYVKSYIIEK